jgi:putative transposase
VKYAFIRDQSDVHDLSKMCRVLGVSTRGYYVWVDRPEIQRARDNRRLISQIRCHHQSSRQIYGSPRIHLDLVERI